MTSTILWLILFGSHPVVKQLGTYSSYADCAKSRFIVSSLLHPSPGGGYPNLLCVPSDAEVGSLFSCRMAGGSIAGCSIPRKAQ